LGDADLLLHIVDISNPNYREHIDSVEKILSELDLLTVNRVLVYNKIDSLEDGVFIPEDGIPISSINKTGFYELLLEIENRVKDKWAYFQLARASSIEGKIIT